LIVALLAATDAFLNTTRDVEMSDVKDFLLHALPADGRRLPADTDHLLTRTTAGALLLIHVPPGDYAYEVHRLSEFIICVDGTFIIEADNGARAKAECGQMIEIPPGLRHRFAPESNAVIITLTQNA
jgi:mannose-6-phosphate isomerase-like protein (cupin superfamily)